jgi:hypothetical protein
MQGCNQTILELNETVTGFKGKLKLWERKMEERKVASFPTLNLLTEDKNVYFTDIPNVIMGHLAKL